LPGAGGGGGNGEKMFHRYKVSIAEHKKVLEIDGGDGCTTV
jgi:hypothetical protein